MFKLDVDQWGFRIKYLFPFFEIKRILCSLQENVLFLSFFAMFNYYYLIISAAAIADTFFQKAVPEESELECCYGKV